MAHAADIGRGIHGRASRKRAVDGIRGPFRDEARDRGRGGATGFLGPGARMEKFTELSGVAAPLPIVNLDTDKIFPSIYLKTIVRTGLAKWLLAEIRFRPDGSEDPDFVLNQAPYRNARILIGADNFGCGSSREHAPWALLDFGIRCVIAPSFADIFYNNCFKNGLLPIALPKETVDLLMEDAKKGANAVMTIDLPNQTITRPDGERARAARPWQFGLTQR
jgi:3-isopropylmalate/(R)-2-methylmalate dehydratase small subunit